jgi:hypothetical protein
MEEVIRKMEIEEIIAIGTKMAEYKAALGSKWTKVFEQRLHDKMESLREKGRKDWTLFETEEYKGDCSRWHSYCANWLGWSMALQEVDPFADEVMEIYNEVKAERQAVLDAARQHYKHR